MFADFVALRSMTHVKPAPRPSTKAWRLLPGQAPRLHGDTCPAAREGASTW